MHSDPGSLDQNHHVFFVFLDVACNPAVLNEKTECCLESGVIDSYFGATLI